MLYYTALRPTTDTTINISVKDFLDNSVGDGEQTLNFTIYDRTIYNASHANVAGQWKSGYAIGGDTPTNMATFSIPVNIMIRDNVAPTAKFKPFYWRTLKENSIYGSEELNLSTNSVADLQGHIELESDWTQTTTYANNPSVALYDADPKVSGKITLEGEANDNVLVKEIWVKVNGIKVGGTTTSDFRKVAERSTATGNDRGWIATTAADDLATDGLKWELMPDTETQNADTFSQEDGNTVRFKLHFDTSKIDGVAAIDVNVEVQAYDRGTPAVSGDNVVYGSEYTDGRHGRASETHTTNTTTAAPTSYYRMDIVPYITGVYRNNRYNTNRARSGAVSLLRGEESNKVTGFNLDSPAISLSSNKNGTGTSVNMTVTASSGSDATFTVPDTAKSGYLYLTVSGVAALNNLNKFTDYNSETNAKAFDHNTIADDRYVHIWRVNTADTFKGSKNAVYPSMARASDGTLYASFSNYGESKVYYTKEFANGDDDSLKASGYKANLAYNYNGTNYYMHDDVYKDTGVATLFWGYDPPEETAIALGPNDEVNVLYAANYQGGSSGSWDGVVASNAGGLYIYGNHAMDTQIQNNNADTKRAKIYRSELYTYDNELNQFKNTRITRAGDYIYIAYYDRLRGSIKCSFVKDELTQVSNTEYTFSYNNNGYFTVTGNGFNNDYHFVLIDGKYYEIKRIGNNTRYYILGYDSTTQFRSKVYRPSTNTSNNGMPWVTLDGDTDTIDENGGTETFVGGWKPFKNINYSDGVTGSTLGTGESVSITTNGNGYPVIFYMDAATGCLRIARASSVNPNTTNDWHVQGVFSTNDDNYDTASDYLSCVVDSQGYLHIAFQNTKGQLVYAVSTNNPSNGTTAYTFGESKILDDSGMWIDMTMNGTTPYISYLSRVNSYDGMKIAFFDRNFDEDNDGEAEGGWETITAAMDAKVTSVRTCIEPNSKAADGTAYTAAIGYCPGLDYRAAFYVGQ